MDNLRDFGQLEVASIKKLVVFNQELVGIIQQLVVGNN